jgi:hypothetical protein
MAPVGTELVVVVAACIPSDCLGNEDNQRSVVEHMFCLRYGSKLVLCAYINLNLLFLK